MNTTALLPADPTAPPAAGTALIEAHDLTRIWGKGDAAQIGVSGVDLRIDRGELVAVIGPSGSGRARWARSSPGSTGRPRDRSSSTAPASTG